MIELVVASKNKGKIAEFEKAFSQLPVKGQRLPRMLTKRRSIICSTRRSLAWRMIRV